MKKLVTLLAILLVTACSGYRFKNQSNPFDNYGIRTVAVPLFLNQSPIPNAAAPFTKEITLLLSQYPGLEIVGADTGHADAVLVGIVNSKDKTSETIRTTGYKITNSVAPKALAGRSDFFVPFATEIKLEVNLILIKDPSTKELELLSSELGASIRGNPKILFNETIQIVGNFNREIHDSAGTQVNFTQNKGAQERTVKSMATSLSQSFKEMVLYAF
ncbi:MAG: hypothetical protein ACOYL6_01855 [Bacteriovoracaceae bacterium]